MESGASHTVLGLRHLEALLPAQKSTTPVPFMLKTTRPRPLPVAAHRLQLSNLCDAMQFHGYPKLGSSLLTVDSLLGPKLRSASPRRCLPGQVRQWQLVQRTG